MALENQNIIVDIQESFIETAYANQYDNGRCELSCYVENDGMDFNCTDYIVSLHMKKSNGYVFLKTIGDDFGSVSGNIVTIPIINKMTVSAGRQDCRLELVHRLSNTRKYTCNFYLRVRKDPTAGDIPDTPEYSSLQEQIDDLKDREEAYSENEPTNQVAGGFWTQLLESSN